MSRYAWWRGYADVTRAEWIKVRTLPATGWLLGGTVVLGVGLSAIVCSVVGAGNVAGADRVKAVLSGVQVAQATIAIWSAQTVGGEYRNGLIWTTLIATPRRATVLAAKLTVVAAVVLMTGALTVGGSLLAAPAISAAGHPLAGPTARAAFGSVFYLGLVGVLAAGTAVATRSSAAATSLVLALLYVSPLVARLAGNIVGNAAWQLQPWTGIPVLAAWAAAAVLVAGLVFGRRG